MKVTAFEETRDLRNIKVDEIIGSLQTFQMSIGEILEKNNKCIDFVSNSEEGHGDKEENGADDITHLGRKVNKS